MALEVPVVNIVYMRGDSRPITFKLTKDAAGNPKDLTGWTAPVLAVNEDPVPEDTTDELFKVDGAEATIVVPETGGLISFTPKTDATGSDQEPGVYYYNGQALDNNGKKTTFVKGTFTIEQDIAKD